MYTFKQTSWIYYSHCSCQINKLDHIQYPTSTLGTLIKSIKLYLKLFVAQPPNCLKNRTSDIHLVINNRKIECCMELENHVCYRNFFVN